jgi:hypothetical protein
MNNLIDRRSLMRSILGGAAVAAVGGATAVTLISDAVEAAPLVLDKSLPAKTDDLVREAQVVVTGPRRRRWRRRRRRVCWWRRGRRVCAWRWV